MKNFFLLALVINMVDGLVGNTIIVNESDPNSSLYYYLCNNSFQLQSDTVFVLSHLQEHVLHQQMCVVTNVNNLTLQSSYPTYISCNPLSLSGVAFFNVSNVSFINIEFTKCGSELPPILFQNLYQDVFYFSRNQSATLLFSNCSNIQFININITNYYGFAAIFINPNGYSFLHKIAVKGSNGVSKCNPNTSTIDISCIGSGIVIYYIKNFKVSETKLVSNFTVKQALFDFNINLPIISEQTLPQIFAQHSIPISSFGASLTVLFSKGTYKANINISHLIIKDSFALFGGLAAIFANAPLKTTIAISKSRFVNFATDIPVFNQTSSSGIGIYIHLNKSYFYNFHHLWTPIVMEDIDVYFHSTALAQSSTSVTQEFRYGNVYIGLCQQNEFLQNQPNITINIILKKLNHYQFFTGYRLPFLHAETYNSLRSSFPIVKLLHLNITDCVAVCIPPSTFTSLNYGKFVLINLASVTFEGTNRFINNTGSVIQAINTNIHFKGLQNFSNNQANYGAGINLASSSLLFIYDTSHTEFVNNQASFYGGAIYSYNSQLPNNIPLCTLQIISKDSKNFSVIGKLMKFVNNSALLSGNSIYSTSLYRCLQKQHRNIQNSLLYQSVFSFNNNKSEIGHMSSQPVHVCFCNFINTSHFSCIQQQQKQKVYLGSVLTFGLMVQDELNTPTYGQVEVSLHLIAKNHSKRNLIPYVNYLIPLEQRIQRVYSDHCTPLSYTLQNPKTPSNSLLIKMQFAVTGLAPDSFVSLNLTQCPIGFTIDNETNKCNCSHFFQRNGLKYCNINAKTIQVPQHVWIGGDTTNPSNIQLQYASYCPFGYCSNEKESVNISFVSLETLCTGNRVGTLCGQCKKGYSRVIGVRASCRICSNSSLFIVPIYLICGLLYVLALYIFKFTIDAGTIGGLSFWITFMTPYVADTKAKLNYIGRISMFITLLTKYNWLESTCVWDGMNSLEWAALGFFFPIYLWLLVGFIVIVSKRSAAVSNLAVGSSVQVLATLMYLSFSEVISNSIRILTPSYIYTEGLVTPNIVWYWDGTIKYGHNIYHIGLVIVSCLALVGFIIPYLLLGTFGTVFLRNPCILKYCRPFINAFHGPYTVNNYDWFGYRLILITLLHIMDFINRLTHIQPFLVAVILIIFVIIQATKMPFINLPLNLIDLWFMFLLILASISTLAFGTDNCFNADVIPILGLLAALCIFGYHITIGFGRLLCLKNKAKTFYNKCNQWYNMVCAVLVKNTRRSQYEPITDVTESLSGYREPLDVIYH